MTTPPPFSWTLLVVCVLGFGLLWWLVTRTTADRVLRRVVLLSYLSRVLLGIGLYAISYWNWPILRSLQLGNGFWALGFDSDLYHRVGILIAEAWKTSMELPNFDLGIEYFAIVAALYRVLGAHPLYPIVLNSLLAAGTGLLAYRISRRLSCASAARTAAILVACWPSSFIWSAQLLKDATTWFLLFAALALVVELLPRAQVPKSRRRWMLTGILLVGVVILLTRLRFYLGPILSVASATVFVPLAMRAAMRRRFTTSAQYAGLAFLLVASTLFARTLDTKKLLSPRHPERGHMQLAMQYWQQGDLAQAEREFTRTLALKRGYDPEALLGLAAVTIEAGHLEKATNVYKDFLEGQDPEKRFAVKRIVAQIYLERGDHDLNNDQLEAATSAYSQAFSFDPAFVPASTKLTMALAQQQQFIQAFAVLEKTSSFAHTVKERQHLEALREWVVAMEQSAFQDSLAVDPASSWSPTPARLASPNEAAGVALPTPTMGAITPPLWRGGPPAAGGVASRPPAGVYTTTVAPAKDPGGRAEPVSTNAPAVFAATPALPPAPEALPSPSGGHAEPVSTTDLASQAMELFLMSQRSGAGRAGSSEGVGVLQDIVAEMYDQAPRTFYSGSNPELLDLTRQSFVVKGGHGLMDATVDISNPRQLLRYLPRALLIGFFAPFPWQWAGLPSIFDAQGSTGAMRTVAGLEMLLVYLLLPAILLGVVRTLRARRPEGFLLLAVVGVMAIPLSLVVANIGTLFRLRLLFLLPLLLVAAQGEPLRIYSRLLSRLRQGRPPAPVPVGAHEDPVGIAPPAIEEDRTEVRT